MSVRATPMPLALDLDQPGLSLEEKNGSVIMDSLKE
jgi:hypothetical protein